jgi:hypothetical protein
MKKRRGGTEKAARAVLAVVVPTTASLLGNISGICSVTNMLVLRELRLFVTVLPIRRLGSPKGGDGIEAVHKRFGPAAIRCVFRER